MEQAGLTLSAGDRFVIAAAQTLIDAAGEKLDFEAIRDRLEAARVTAAETVTSPG